MKEKIRAFVSIFCVAAMVLTVFSGCGSNDETVTDGGKENQKIEQTIAEEKPYVIDYQVVNVGDVSAISDSDGIRILNEVSGEESKIFEEPAGSMAFNGETLYFFTAAFPDETDESGAVEQSKEFDKLYSYSVLTEELSEIFDSNSHWTEFVYLDENAIYYIDMSEDAVVDTVAWDFPLDYLYKYDISSGEKSVVLKDIGEIEYVDGNFVYQSERYMNGDRGFHPTHIYNIKSGKSYDIDQCAKFIYADDERIYFVTQDEEEYNIDFDYESCSFTGTDKKLVSELDFLAEESEYGAYLEGDEIILANWVGEGASFTYNIKTGEVKDYDLEAFYNNDDEETVLKETANGYYVGKYDDETYIVTFHQGEMKK